MERATAGHDGARLTGEEASQRDLASTEVTPAVAYALSLAFVAAIALVPITQAVVDVYGGGPVQALQLFSTPPTARSLHAFEDAVARQSWLRRAVQPRLQLALTRWFGVGNDTVIVGRDGWLFYQPGVDYAAGPGFLDEAYLSARAARMAEREGVPYPQPNPLPALLALQRAVARTGGRLVIVPLPDKAMRHGDRLATRLGSADAPPNNPDYPRLVAMLREAGADVFEPPPLTFLAQDTHWTPASMQSAATALAAFLRPLIVDARAADWQVRPARVSRVGDLVDMLQLPPGQTTFRPETVMVERVVDAAGHAWRPDVAGDVLLLGDSFTNIYSAPQMGWGDSAGFAEHLSYALGRPVDVVARNGGAASLLSTELTGPGMATRLAAKRVVVFAFAVRELAGRHWAVPDLSAVTPPGPVAATQAASTPASAQPAPPGPTATQGANRLTIEGTIQQVSTVPDPDSAPYASCVSMYKVRVDRVVEGRYGGREIVAGMLVMSERRLLPPARYVPGNRVRLELIPFDEAGRDVRSLQRSDDLQDFTTPAYWTIAGERR